MRTVGYIVTSILIAVFAAPMLLIAGLMTLFGFEHGTPDPQTLLMIGTIWLGLLSGLGVIAFAAFKAVHHTFRGRPS
jgi:hypothetical protein